MKLIHCSDLHLDSKMGTHLPPELAALRRNEILSTFVQTVELANENDVVAILISGDLFDSNRKSRKTEQYVLDLIARHPNLFFFYISGNHDSGYSFGDIENLPQNLKLFNNDWTGYAVGDDIEIIGSEQPDLSTLEPNPEKINILMLHGNEKRGGTAGFDFSLLRNKGIDYVALGDYHSFEARKIDSRCTACYSGCLEGRGFDEVGPKGYVLLDITDRKVEYHFVPCAKRCIHALTLNVDGCSSQRELEEKAEKLLEEISSNDMVKITLTGHQPADSLLDFSRLESLLTGRFFFSKLDDQTKLEIHPEDYLHDVSLKGEFIRQVMNRNLPPEEAEKIILCGLRVLYGEEPEL